MTNAHFYVYNVGHGLCTLLTGKSRDEKNREVPYIGIFDCGYTDENPKSSIYSALFDMKEKIIGSTESDKKYIDVVVISHQDTDHWSLLLNLFAMLNGEEDGNYEDVCFRWETNRAWMLHTGFKNSNDLYIIEDNKITLKSYTKNYLCDISVEYGDDTTPISLNIELTLRNISKYSGFKYTVRSIYNNKFYDIVFYVNDFKRKAGTINKVKQEIVRHILVEILDNYLENDPEAVSIALQNLIASLTDNMQSCLFEGLQSGNEIKSTFKRVIMGGDQIQPEYERLGNMFHSICTYIMGDAGSFYRVKEGAYIILKENAYPAFAIRNFPDHGVEVPLKNVTVIRNLTSIVVQFNITKEIKPKKVLLLPGDVTVHVFNLIRKYLAYLGDNSLKMILAPHHGSDNTNFFENKNNPNEPLFSLFNYINFRQADCNLVISGYNSKYVHPGQDFTVSARKCFHNDDDNLHSYAYAFDKVAYAFDKVKVQSDGLNYCYDGIRIFTTNVLENEYFGLDIDDANNRIKFIPFNGDSSRNSLCRIPSDDSFI